MLRRDRPTSSHVKRDLLPHHLRQYHLTLGQEADPPLEVFLVIAVNKEHAPHHRELAQQGLGENIPLLGHSLDHCTWHRRTPYRGVQWQNKV